MADTLENQQDVLGTLERVSNESDPYSINQGYLTQAVVEPTQVQAAPTQVQAAPALDPAQIVGSTQFQQAMALARKITPEATPFNPALASLLYFTKMGELASQKGSSVFGSIAGAGVAPAAYLMQKEKEKAARDAGLGKTAVSIMGALKPKKAGKPTFYLNSKGEKVPFTDVEFAALPRKEQLELTPFKAPGAGTRVERAQAQLIELGPKLANGTATEAEIQDYYLKYMDLSSPKESKRIVDGEEVTEFEPGIDLTLIAGLPIPEGYDPKKILNRRNRKYSDSQVDSAGFGNRMLITEGTVRNMLESGYQVNASDIAKIRSLSALGLSSFKTAGLSAQAQRFHNAASNFVAAQLRKESGAAIGPQEYADAIEQYFPQATSSPEGILDKQGLRESLILGMVASGGDAFRNNYKSAVPFLTGMKDGKKVDVINPVGYFLTVNARTKSGRGIHFASNLKLMEVDELKNMLGLGASRYTGKQLGFIGDEIRRKEAEVPTP